MFNHPLGVSIFDKLPAEFGQERASIRHIPYYKVEELVSMRPLAPGESKFSACQSAFLSQPRPLRPTDPVVQMFSFAFADAPSLALMPLCLNPKICCVVQLHFFVCVTSGTCSMLTKHIGHYCHHGCIM